MKNKDNIHNSEHFVQIIKGNKLDPVNILVNCGVKSLFTNVSVSKTIEIIQERGFSTEMIQFLKAVINSNVFTINGKYYRQNDGMTIDSRLGQIFANIFMEKIDEPISHRNRSQSVGLGIWMLCL